MKPQFPPPFTVPPDKIYLVLSGGYSVVPGNQKMGHTMSSDVCDVVLSINQRTTKASFPCMRMFLKKNGTLTVQRQKQTRTTL